MSCLCICAGTTVTPEDRLQDAFTELCRRDPEGIAELVYCYREEPVRCFRALVYQLNWESGLRKSDVEAMLQEAFSRPEVCGLGIRCTPEVVALIRKKRDEFEQRKEVCSYVSRLVYSCCHFVEACANADRVAGLLRACKLKKKVLIGRKIGYASAFLRRAGSCVFLLQGKKQRRRGLGGLSSASRRAFLSTALHFAVVNAFCFRRYSIGTWKVRGGVHSDLLLRILWIVMLRRRWDTNAGCGALSMLASRFAYSAHKL